MTTLSEDLEHILFAVEQTYGRGEQTNRLKSHVKDAIAHAKVLEWENTQLENSGASQSLRNGQKVDDCLCPDGGRAAYCPVHGFSVKT